MPDDRGEGDHCDRHSEYGQELDADRSGQWVVQDAVVHEAVAARVPEVVPEHEAVLDEQCALVHVSRQVGSGRTKPDEHGGEHSRTAGGDEQVGAALRTKGGRRH